MKFGFYVSGQASRLKKYLGMGYDLSNIACIIHDGEKAFDLQKVAANKDIPFFHHSAGRSSEMGLSEFLLNHLVKAEIDYCFCFGRKLLHGHVMQVYKDKIINFHPSLLPAFPGINAIDQGLEAGALLFGNTAHFIDAGIDTGPIIMQSIVPSVCYDGYDSILDLQIPMLRQIISWLQDDRLFLSATGQVKIKDRREVADEVLSIEHVASQPYFFW